MAYKGKSRSCCTKCCIGTVAYLFIVIILLLLVAFVIVPVIFKYSIGIQRSIIFPTWYVEEKNYSDFKPYSLKGIRNFYVPVNEVDNIILGVWQILPQTVVNEFVENDDYDFNRILSSSKYNVVLYLHGNGQDRTGSVGMYSVLRKFFNVIACDYRGYGDSSKGELNETAVVSDIVSLYKWIQNQTSAKIFVWGHSIGTGVGTHLVSNLKSENIFPSGLVLEAPFTSVPDIIEQHQLVKIFKWLPWFRSTIIHPIVDNDLDFNSKRYIINVDCPILILHAKDDEIIPYHFATDLYSTAVQDRDLTAQGNVTYHLFEAVGYNHEWIFAAPNLPSIISKFVKESLEFEKNRIIL